MTLIRRLVAALHSPPDHYAEGDMTGDNNVPEVRCQHCHDLIYNDSDSHPPDPAGPWADTITTSYVCPSNGDTGAHQPPLPRPKRRR